MGLAVWQLWALFAVHGDCSSSSNSSPSQAECTRVYGDMLETWLSLSRAVSVYTPTEHRPDWYWEGIVDLRNKDRQSTFGALEKTNLQYTNSWLDRLFGEAHGELKGCQVWGGRYWEVTLRLRSLLEKLPEVNASKALRRISRFVTRQGFNSLSQVPEMLRKSVCLPGACTAHNLLEALQRYFEIHLLGSGLQPGWKPSLPVLQDLIEVEEMVDWAEFQLNFAIIGVDNCGTTSLNKNLEKHPEIVFTSSKEETFFTAAVVHRLLPLKSQVQAFNERVKVVIREKTESTGIAPRLVGICNPVMFSLGLSRAALSLIPSLKAILVLCDPLGRMERCFLERHFCQDDLEAAKQRGHAAGERTASDSCFRSAAALLEERNRKLRPFWERLALAPHFEPIKRLFATDALVMHQDSLRSSAPQLFRSLVAILGARYTYPADTQFHRYNAVGGHRTDLCQNASLVAALQRLLEPEYLQMEQLLAEAGEPVPAELALRRSRCHRPGELAPNAERCPHRRACARPGAEGLQSPVEEPL